MKTTDGILQRPRRACLTGAAALIATVLSAAAAVAQPPPFLPPAAPGTVPPAANQAPSQQPGSGLPIDAAHIRTAAQSLRTAARQFSLDDRPPNFGMARTAVAAGIAAVDDVPAQTPTGAARQAARMSLSRAADLLGRPDPAPFETAQALVMAANALDIFAARLVANVVDEPGPAAPAQGAPAPAAPTQGAPARPGG